MNEEGRMVIVKLRKDYPQEMKGKSGYKFRKEGMNLRIGQLDDSIKSDADLEIFALDENGEAGKERLFTPEAKRREEEAEKKKAEEAREKGREKATKQREDVAAGYAKQGFLNYMKIHAENQEKFRKKHGGKAERLWNEDPERATMWDGTPKKTVAGSR